MKVLVNIIVVIMVLFSSVELKAQQEILSLQEYLAMVKRYHPLVKQANLILTDGEASLLEARGAFDPKLELDYKRKKFEGSTYYDQLNSVFRIPTWYGVEFKARFEENSGSFLNPDQTLPQDGLYSAGVSVSLAKGLLINERMASLRQAKFYVQQSEAEQQLAVNNVLVEAAKTYIDWVQADQIKELFEGFLVNAQFRFDGVKKSFERGDLAAIDTLEAGINVQNRQLGLEQAKLNLLKARLKVSNFLWAENDFPIELQENVIPEEGESLDLSGLAGLTDVTNFNIEFHPKIRSLIYKSRGLKIEQRLKRNNLLPQVDLEYNFLNENIDQRENFNTANYTSGLKVSFPLFLRKERGALKRASLKYADVNYELESTRISLANKIEALENQMTSLDEQTDIAESIAVNYEQLLRGEVRKFDLGESSIFLVNSRESSLISARLKAFELQAKRYYTTLDMLQALGIEF